MTHLPPRNVSRRRSLTRQIGSVFASLSGEAEVALPTRFIDLKRCVDRFDRADKNRSIIGDADNQARLRASWARLCQRLGELAPWIEREQQNVRHTTARAQISI